MGPPGTVQLVSLDQDKRFSTHAATESTYLRCNTMGQRVAICPPGESDSDTETRLCTVATNSQAPAAGNEQESRTCRPGRELARGVAGPTRGAPVAGDGERVMVALGRRR
jgi:hypothetical protein